MIKRLKLFLFLLLLSFFSTTGSATAQLSNESFWDRVYFGGSFGLQFGTVELVDISPMAGYRITEKLSVGVSATYLYYSYNDPYNSNYDYSSNIYGGSLFSRYYVLENIFLHVEGEVLNVEVPDYFLQQYVRENVFGFYVGGGIRQPMGNNGSLNISLLYDLNNGINSPYQNPIIQIGFAIGI